MHFVYCLRIEAARKFNHIGDSVATRIEASPCEDIPLHRVDFHHYGSNNRSVAASTRVINAQIDIFLRVVTKKQSMAVRQKLYVMRIGPKATGAFEAIDDSECRVHRVKLCGLLVEICIAAIRIQLEIVCLVKGRRSP